MIRQQLRRLRLRRPRGQSLVEFTLIVPVFALLFAATLDLGRLFYAQITLTNAAREGAFEAARDPNQFRFRQPCDTTNNRVVCRVILESNQSFVLIDPADIDMACSPDCSESLGNDVTLTVSGEFRLITPLLSPFTGGSQLLNLQARATAQREFLPSPPASFAFPTPPTPTPAPTPTPSPEPSGPTPTPGGPTPSPTPAPECLVDYGPNIGVPGVHPPNVVGLQPNQADNAIVAKGLVPVAEGDLTTGPRNKVREQNPDWTLCVEPGTEIHYKYRP